MCTMWGVTRPALPLGSFAANILTAFSASDAPATSRDKTDPSGQPSKRTASFSNVFGGLVENEEKREATTAQTPFVIYPQVIQVPPQEDPARPLFGSGNGELFSEADERESTSLSAESSERLTDVEDVVAQDSRAEGVTGIAEPPLGHSLAHTSLKRDAAQSLPSGVDGNMFSVRHQQAPTTPAESETPQSPMQSPQGSETLLEGQPDSSDNTAVKDQRSGCDLQTGVTRKGKTGSSLAAPGGSAALPHGMSGLPQDAPLLAEVLPATAPAANSTPQVSNTSSSESAATVPPSSAPGEIEDHRGRPSTSNRRINSDNSSSGSVNSDDSPRPATRLAFTARLMPLLTPAALSEASHGSSADSSNPTSAPAQRGGRDAQAAISQAGKTASVPTTSDASLQPNRTTADTEPTSPGPAIRVSKDAFKSGQPEPEPTGSTPVTPPQQVTTAAATTAVLSPAPNVQPEDSASHNTTTTPEAQAAVAPEPAQGPALPGGPAAPARDIQLQLHQGDQRVDVRLSERSGEVRVAVRTPDPQLANSLRSDLPGLSARLEQTGFRAETWHPALSETPSGLERRPPATETSFSNPQGGGQPQSRQEGQQQPPRQPKPNEAPAATSKESSDDPQRKEFQWLISQLS
jgi:hypothetical protein